jgi:hypothetical protein
VSIRVDAQVYQLQRKQLHTVESRRVRNCNITVIHEGHCLGNKNLLLLCIIAIVTRDDETKGSFNF